MINLPSQAQITLTLEELNDLIEEAVIEALDNQGEGEGETQTPEEFNARALDFLNIKKNSVTYMKVSAAIYLLENPQCQGYSVNQGSVIYDIKCV